MGSAVERHGGWTPIHTCSQNGTKLLPCPARGCGAQIYERSIGTAGRNSTASTPKGRFSRGDLLPKLTAARDQSWYAGRQRSTKHTTRRAASAKSSKMRRFFNRHPGAGSGAFFRKVELRRALRPRASASPSFTGARIAPRRFGNTLSIFPCYLWSHRTLMRRCRRWSSRAHGRFGRGSQRKKAVSMVC